MKSISPNKTPRIGVFVCNCGINIGGVVDVPAVREYAQTLPYVALADENLFTCSQDTQERIKEVIQEHRLKPGGGGLVQPQDPRTDVHGNP